MASRVSYRLFCLPTLLARFVPTALCFFFGHLRWILHIAASGIAMILCSGFRYPYHFTTRCIISTGIILIGSCSRCLCFLAVRTGTITGRIVNRNARLDIITVDIEADAFSFVLNGVRFHLNATTNKIVALEHRGYPIRNMVACFTDIVSHHIFKR